jgi:hypothetical protein
LPRKDAIKSIPRSKLDNFLKQHKLKWKAPPDFGDTQEEITKYLLSEVLGPMKKTHDALMAKAITMVKS